MVNFRNYNELIKCPDCSHPFGRHNDHGCYERVPSEFTPGSTNACPCEHTTVTLMDLYIQRLVDENADLRSKGNGLADTLDEGIGIVKQQDAEITRLTLVLEKIANSGRVGDGEYNSVWEMIDGIRKLSNGALLAAPQIAGLTKGYYFTKDELTKLLISSVENFIDAFEESPLTQDASKRWAAALTIYSVDYAKYVDAVTSDRVCEPPANPSISDFENKEHDNG